ncbi:MAG: primosomal protein N', partial [Kamptonema sp. SIO4C4]|nr:primosomal protein N' [Kamptonema sp. SIO4C4]
PAVADQGGRHALAHHHGGERQVAGGDALGHGHQVGLDAVAVGTEPVAQPAEAADHLVGHQQHIVAPADLLHPRPVALRRDDHAAGALDGLADEGGDAVGAQLHDTAAQLLRCHFCNYTQLHPPQCPECGSPFLKFFGTGTQRVMRELGKHFPELRAIRFDSDTTRNKGAHRALLSQFTRGDADLLVGTQMLTKGLDIEQVTLVGIVSADGLLNIADYRASEQAFQTLTQVSGRAGRGNDPGQVILQTYTPDHPVIHAVKQHQYAPFAQEILEERASLFYPPYGRLVLLRVSGLDAGEVETAADTVAQGCHNLLQPHCEYQLLGPAPAKIMRINRHYRWHILLKLPTTVQQLPP